MSQNINESQQEILKTVQEVATIVTEMAGIQLGPKQYPMIENRLKTRMLKMNIPTFGAYLKYLKNNKESESQALLSLMTTHHTYFFREFSQFEFMLNRSLNRIIEMARSRPDKTIKVLSAACSKGHEVYSLAMFFHFHLKSAAPDLKFKIYGTDIDPESVKTAQNGVYRADELKQSPAMYLDGHWIRGQGQVADFSKVKDHLKTYCTFQTANLLSYGSFLNGKDFDIIFCRNVFIYFNQDQIKQISQNLLKALNPGGFLFLGLSETLNGLGLPIDLVGPSVYGAKVPVSNKSIPPLPKPQEPRIYEVLCIDDSKTVHSLLGKILIKDQGFEIKAQAFNGLEAIEILKTKKFDFITLDLHMPELDGVGFLTEYKDRETPILVISSINRDDTSIAQKAISLGASDYVEKPSFENLAQAGNEIRSKLKMMKSISARTNSNSNSNSKTSTASSMQNFVSKNSNSNSTSAHSYQSQPNKISNTRTTIHPKSAIASTHSRSNLKPLAKNVTSSRTATAVTSLSSLKGSNPAQINTFASTTSKSGPIAKASSERTVKKVLIVDDSKTIRILLRNILEKDSRFQVVAEAEKPSEVMPLIEKHKPDVMTLDIHMPEMTGVELLKKIFPKTKIPTVMITSISREEGTFILDALEAGAIDYIQKPSQNQMTELSKDICDRVFAAASTQFKGQISLQRAVKSNQKITNTKDSLILIGSSTGGTETLKYIMESFPSEIPPILIVQHIPPVFSAAFADRLNKLFPFEVKEAAHGDEVKPNRVLIAPGGKQMAVKRAGDKLIVAITDDAPVNRHKPSVDYLFNSFHQLRIQNAVATILTGMGADGALGLKKLKDLGVRTIGQDEATSVVYGMPKEAFLKGGVEFVLPMQDIGRKMMELCQNMKNGKENSLNQIQPVKQSHSPNSVASSKLNSKLTSNISTNKDSKFSNPFKKSA